MTLILHKRRSAMANQEHNYLVSSDERDLIQRAIERDGVAIGTLVRTYNRRLYRIARSIVRDDIEAEDVLQDAYLKAFSMLGTFRFESSFATWLSRIVINEALQRARKRIDTPLEKVPAEFSAEIIPFPASASYAVDPERTVALREIYKMVEHAIDRLPEDFRVVLIARAVEGLSVAETAELVGIKAETVKTRLHRARLLLKADITDRIGQVVSDVFPFDGERCGRLTKAVVAALTR